MEFNIGKSVGFRLDKGAASGLVDQKVLVVLYGELRHQTATLALSRLFCLFGVVYLVTILFLLL